MPFHKRHRPCCPNGHMLSQVRASERLRKFPYFVPQLNCDNCKSYIRGSEMIGTCDACDFDMCSSCFYAPCSRSTGVSPVDQVERKRRVSGQGTATNVLKISSAMREPERYNHLRLHFRNTRDPFHLYPDPTLYGWEFTGSSEQRQTEFFERRIGNETVLLDLSLCHGTIETVLDSPNSNPRILFVSSGVFQPEVYVRVLQSPKHNTLEMISTCRTTIKGSDTSMQVY